MDYDIREAMNTTPKKETLLISLSLQASVNLSSEWLHPAIPDIHTALRDSDFKDQVRTAVAN